MRCPRIFYRIWFLITSRWECKKTGDFIIIIKIHIHHTIKNLHKCHINNRIAIHKSKQHHYNTSKSEQFHSLHPLFLHHNYNKNSSQLLCSLVMFMICHVKIGNNTGLISDNSCSQSSFDCTQLQNKAPIATESLAHSSNGGLLHMCIFLKHKENDVVFTLF